MPTTPNPPEPSEMTLQQRRDEIMAILVTGLLRLSSTRQPPGEKLSQSAGTGLELPRETRLSVPAG